MLEIIREKTRSVIVIMQEMIIAPLSPGCEQSLLKNKLKSIIWSFIKSNIFHAEKVLNLYIPFI